MNGNKRWISFGILLAILLFGFYLRVYHLNFPSIGYHNMKENEYYSEALFFYNDGDFLHRRTYNFWGLEDGPGYFEEYAQAPIIPYLTTIAWHLFGAEELWVMRTIIILFFLGSVVTLYLLVRKLTRSEYLALLSAFIMTILPLGIYFGRNIQPESPGLFFMILSLYLYTLWLESQETKHALLSGLSFGLMAMFKITFLISIVPMLATFPWKKYQHHWHHHKKKVYELGYFALGFLPFILVQGLFEWLIADPSKKAGSELTIGKLLAPFTSSYWAKTWPAISSYIADNFTWAFFWLAVIGLVLIFLKRNTLFGKFFMGWLIALPLYWLPLSSKMGGHAYYQMPFLPLVAVASAYVLYVIGGLLLQASGQRAALYVPLIILVFTAGSVQESADRVWDTLFYGQDVLGQYIKEITEPGERFINEGHAQTQAVCTFARRRCGEIHNLEDIKRYEEQFDIRFIHLDTFGYQRLQRKPELFAYVESNYRIRALGALEQGQELVPTNFLLERGGTLDLNDLSDSEPRLVRTYTTKRGNVNFYLVEN